MELVIYQPRMLGDVILCSTVAKLLKKKYKNKCKIVYITGYSNVLKYNPYVDEVISIPLYESVKSSLLKALISSLFLYFIKIKYKNVHFIDKWTSDKNILESYINQFNLSGKDAKTKIFLSTRNIEIAKKYLKSVVNNGITIAIQNDFERKWKSGSFEELKELLGKEFNVVEVGEGMEYRGEVLSLLDVVAIISESDLFVGGVSGLMHAAVAVDVPTVCTSNVMDPRLDMPEFYSDSFMHKTVKRGDFFCNKYLCVMKDAGDSVRVMGGDFSPKYCPVSCEKSCISSITSHDIHHSIVNHIDKLKLN